MTEPAKETRMREFIISHYDRLASEPETYRFYNSSDYLNFGYWEESTGNQKEACEALMAQLIALMPGTGDSILDVACGKGASTAYLRRHYPAENIAAINISDVQLAAAERNAPGCRFSRMSATQMEFGDESFDRVICVEAAFNFCTREKFLHEALRVLKPGGCLVLSDLLMTLEAEVKRESRTEENYIRDIAEYRALLAKVGFNNIQVVDTTEECWHGHFRYAVRYFHEKFLDREITRARLQECLHQTYNRVPDIEFYLLAAGTKP